MDEEFLKSLQGMQPHEKVAAIRKHRGLSQKRIAEILDVHWITVSRIERGIIRLSREWIDRIAFALNVNESDIHAAPQMTNSIRMDGEILPGGILFRGQIFDHVTESNQFVGDTYYYSFQCDDFKPIATRYDIVKAVQVRKNQWPSVIGRMCVATSADRKKRVIGFLDTVPDNDLHGSEQWDRYVIRNSRREIIFDEGFHIESVATEIIFTFNPPEDEELDTYVTNVQ